MKGAPINAGNHGDGPAGAALAGMPIGIYPRIHPPAVPVADQGKAVVLHHHQELDPGVALEQGLAGADHAGEILVDRGPGGHVAQGHGHAVGLGFQVEQNRPLLLGNDHQDKDAQSGQGHQPGQQGRTQGNAQAAALDVFGIHGCGTLLNAIFPALRVRRNGPGFQAWPCPGVCGPYPGTRAERGPGGRF